MFLSLIKKDEEIAKDIIFRLFSLKQPFKGVLTSERKLSEHYRVSRNTIRNSLNILINIGIIKKDSKGYNLCATKRDYDTFDALLLAGEDGIANQILQVEDTESDKEISNKISQPLGTKIKIITYLRRNKNNVPISLDNVIVPSDKLTGDIWQLNNTSAIRLLCTQNKTFLSREYQEISLQKVSDYEAKLLNLEANSTVVVRDSLFTNDTTFLFAYLHSIKITDTCLIVQPNKEIFNKVGGFIE